MSFSSFKKLFSFDPAKAGFVGVERENFIEKDGEIVPLAHKLLSSITPAGFYVPVQVAGNFWSGSPGKVPAHWVQVPEGEFGFELSACQLETRSGPCELEELFERLQQTDSRCRQLLSAHDWCTPLYVEVGPSNMPLDVYPDPTGRYQEITRNMPRETLLAACRVIGTHVHIGMPDHETALATYNFVIRRWKELCELGNGSFGERLAIYRQMAPDYEPKPYDDWNRYYQVARQKGFAEDPRRCWTLIRISVHGTLEFRMFGATDSIDRIVSWAARCHELCQEALAFA